MKWTLLTATEIKTQIGLSEFVQSVLCVNGKSYLFIQRSTLRLAKRPKGPRLESCLEPILSVEVKHRSYDPQDFCSFIRRSRKVSNHQILHQVPFVLYPRPIIIKISLNQPDEERKVVGSVSSRLTDLFWPHCYSQLHPVGFWALKFQPRFLVLRTTNTNKS